MELLLLTFNSFYTSYPEIITTCLPFLTFFCSTVTTPKIFSAFKLLENLSLNFYGLSSTLSVVAKNLRETKIIFSYGFYNE